MVFSRLNNCHNCSCFSCVVLLRAGTVAAAPAPVLLLSGPCLLLLLLWFIPLVVVVANLAVAVIAACCFRRRIGGCQRSSASREAVIPASWAMAGLPSTLESPSTSVVYT